MQTPGLGTRPDRLQYNTAQKLGTPSNRLDPIDPPHFSRSTTGIWSSLIFTNAPLPSLLQPADGIPHTLCLTMDVATIDASRSRAILVVTSVFLGISLVSVALRIFVRTRIVRAFGWDDSIMVLAMVSTAPPLPRSGPC
jgi:hypothetical protein